jgi:signal transduction histidine kinase
VLAESGEDAEVRARFVHNIVDAANRLVDTSRALLVLARAEAGTEPPRPEVLELNRVLSTVFAREHTRECEIDVTCPRDATVLADYDMLVLALGALRDNACRHAAGSPITVGVAEVASGERAEIEIVSDGSRVAAGSGDLSRMAERFVSGEGRDSGGFGIGLSIAERAARLLGGGLSLAADDRHVRARIEIPTAAARAG